MSPITPYKVRPVSPRVATVTEDGTVVDEDGEALREHPPGVRAYASAATVGRLLETVGGEALTWNAQPIRYRREVVPERGWTPRHTDVIAVRASEWPDEDPEYALWCLSLWRDWLASHGAACGSTMGSAAWSLLRATLEGDLWVGVGEMPRLVVIGGRQETREAPGVKIGPWVHWDIPAAYARTLGELVYGGWWRERPRVDADTLDALHSDGVPIFARAVVAVPPFAFGPLPRRPRKAPTVWESFLLPVSYPVSRTMRGVWTWAELEAARDYGCAVRVLQAWTHVVPNQRRPFARWWSAVSEGRELVGFAGQLAKMTGNALWGQFCILRGTKQIRRFDARRGGYDVRDVRVPNGRPRAPDLAEQVTGHVRAALWRVLARASSGVLSAHTDGGWFLDAGDGWTPHGGGEAAEAPGAWRAKEVAERIDFLGPQQMAVYPPGHASPEYRYAGAEDPERTFDERWRQVFKVGYEPGAPQPQRRKATR